MIVKLKGGYVNGPWKTNGYVADVARVGPAARRVICCVLKYSDRWCGRINTNLNHSQPFEEGVVDKRWTRTQTQGIGRQCVDDLGPSRLEGKVVHAHGVLKMGFVKTYIGNRALTISGDTLGLVLLESTAEVAHGARAWEKATEAMITTTKPKVDVR